MICELCGHKSVEYTFTFNHGLAVFLAKLYEAGCPVKTDNLVLTYSQRTNSQKTHYWGLAERVMTEEGKYKAGWWVITKYGKCFVEGRAVISRKVVMMNNRVLRYEGESVRFADIHPGYEYRGDYQRQIGNEVQRSLFE